MKVYVLKPAKIKYYVCISDGFNSKIVILSVLSN